MKQVIVSLLLFFVGASELRSQGLPGRGLGVKENIFLRNRYFKSKESHYNYGIKVPVWKGDDFSHEVLVSNRFTDMSNNEIKKNFGEDEFYSTGFSWTYKHSRKEKENLPWTSTLGFELNGNKLLKNNRKRVSLRIMTGYRSKGSMHNYGVALSSNGAFRGVPIPFYVYNTKFLNQNLMLGFPFISLSGPRKNLTNYQVGLSPMGARVKGIQILSEKLLVNVIWSYSIDSYVINNEQFSLRESLLIEKQTISLEANYRATKKVSLNLSIGREFSKRFYKGENIFNKESSKFDMLSSNFIKTEFGFNF